MSPSRWIITGSHGRIARAILPALARTRPLTGITRAPSDPAERSWEDFFAHPVADEVAGVLHLAWSTVPALAEREPDRAEAIDLPLLGRLARHLLAAPLSPLRSGPPRLVFLSSAAVYGPTPNRPAREEDPLRPIGAYGRAKATAEERLADHAAAGLPVTILRVANPYALAARPQDAQGVIPHLIRHALAGTPFARWGENPVKDYLHAADLIRAIGRILDRPLGGTWNISSGHGTGLAELIARVESLVGRSLAIEPRPAPAWDASPSVLSPARLEQTLGWRAEIGLEQGLAALVAARRGAVA